MVIFLVAAALFYFPGDCQWKGLGCEVIEEIPGCAVILECPLLVRDPLSPTCIPPCPDAGLPFIARELTTGTYFFGETNLGKVVCKVFSPGRGECGQFIFLDGFESGDTSAWTGVVP